MWDFFKVLENNVSKAQCILCTQSKVVVSRVGTKPKQFTTTNLRNHIRNKHPLEFQALSVKDEEKALKRTDVVAEQHGENQMAIQTSFDKARVWDINSGPAKEITRLIGEMMALDNQPFLMVEDMGFHRLMRHLGPSYPLPSRFHFSEKVKPDLYERAKKAIADKLKNLDENNPNISYTTDIWTCKHTNDSYISLSAHWVSDTVPAMQPFVLHSSLFSGSHTGPAIASKFEAMLETWNIPLTKCHMAVTDNGANMVNGIELVDIPRGPCFLHTLQLRMESCHSGVFLT